MIAPIPSVAASPDAWASPPEPATGRGPSEHFASLAAPLSHAQDDTRGIMMTFVGLLAVVLIALFDHYTGPRVSFALFYLIPIAAAAWWGGFAHGVLLSLASSVAWFLVDGAELPDEHMAISLWNGVVRFSTFAITSSLLSRLRVSMHREQLLARTDPLTGALNSRTFYECITLEAERGRRMGQPLSLAYLDLDNFKQLNDRLGHLAGDRVLFYLVGAIRRNIRLSDVVARLGGDEFGLLLPNTGVDGTLSLLTRLQRLLSQDMARKGWPVTVSLGAATFIRPPAHVDAMINHVDTLMYRVKRSGKNRMDHEIVEEMIDGEEPGSLEVERRSAGRIACNRLARASAEVNGEFIDEVATVKDLSCGGVGLQGSRQFAPGTLVTVESVQPGGPKILIARVVRARELDGGWFHGCELTWCLTDEEMQSWLRG